MIGTVVPCEPSRLPPSDRAAERGAGSSIDRSEPLHRADEEAEFRPVTDRAMVEHLSPVTESSTPPLDDMRGQILA
jgi:hypothetical protein